MTNTLPRKIVLVLDNIRSVYNTASITRSGAFFGVQEICVCGTTPLPYDRFGRKRGDFAKVALGAEDVVRFAHFPSTLAAVGALRERGYGVVCLEQDARAVPLAQGARHARYPLALILGEERHGIHRSILNIADEIWEIPRVGQKESLNVAVAAGIALWAAQTLAPPGRADSQTNSEPKQPPSPRHQQD